MVPRSLQVAAVITLAGAAVLGITLSPVGDEPLEPPARQAGAERPGGAAAVPEVRRQGPGEAPGRSPLATLAPGSAVWAFKPSDPAASLGAVGPEGAAGARPLPAAPPSLASGPQAAAAGTAASPGTSEPKQPPASSAQAPGQSSLGFVHIPLNGGRTIEELSQRQGLGWIPPREQSWPVRDEPVLLGAGYPCGRREVPPSVLPGARPARQSFCVLRDPYQRMVESFKLAASERPKIFVGFDECYEALNTYVHESLKWMLADVKRPALPYALNCQFLPQAAYVYGWQVDAARVDEQQRWCTTTLSYEKLTLEANAFFEANGYPHRLEEEKSAPPKACSIVDQWSLSPTSRSLIEKVFADDFRLLGFSPLSFLEFIHIPRSGGSAVEDAGKKIYQWGSLNERIKGLKKTGTGLCTGQHTPPSHLQEPFTGVETFCIVRDVYSKMVSQFRLLIIDMNSGTGTYSCNKKDLNRFIQDYLQGKYARELPYGSDCHFLPQGAYVYSWDAQTKRVDTSKRWCKHAILYERLLEDVNSLWRSHGLPVRLKKQTFGHTGGRGCPLKVTDFNEKSQALLNQTYKEDFEMLERLRREKPTWPKLEGPDDFVTKQMAGLPTAAKTTTKVAPPERVLLLAEQEIRRGSLVADDLVTAEDFELEFQLKPRNAVGAGGMSNILRVTATSHHHSSPGDRMPSVEFLPQTTRLQVHMGHNGNHNAFCASQNEVPVGRASKVVIRVSGNVLNLYVNGKEEAKLVGLNNKYKAMEGVKLWIGDLFSDGPDALVSNVIYRTQLDQSPTETRGSEELAFISIPLNGGKAIEELSEPGPAGWGHRQTRLAGQTVVFSQGYPCSQTNIPPSLIPWRYAKRQTFCVVRDPYERIVAEFLRTLEAEAAAVPQTAMECEERLNTFVFNSLQRVLGDAENAARPYSSDCRFLPQAAYVFGWHAKAELVDHGNRSCKRVLRFEGLPQEANDFLAAEGFPRRLGPRQAGPTACTMLGKASLNQVARLLVYRAFRDDFRLLGFQRMDGKPPGVRTLLAQSSAVREGGLLADDLLTAEDFQLTFELRTLAPAAAGAEAPVLALGGAAAGPQRLLACALLAGTTRLQCRMARHGGEDAGCATPEGLSLETASRVEVRLVGEALTISVGGKVQCEASGFTAKHAGMNGVSFWLGDKVKSSQAAEAVIARIHYKVWQDERDSVGWGAPRIPAARTLVASEVRLQRGKMVAHDLVTAEEFEISFDIKAWPVPAVPGILQSVLLLTNTDNQYGHQGDRIPALFFIGGTLRLIAYMGHPNDHNADCSSSGSELVPGKTHHVMVRLQGSTFRMFVDGKEMCFINGYSAKYASMHDVRVFVSGPHCDEAKGKVSNLVYKVAGMSDELDVWEPPVQESAPRLNRTLLTGPVEVKQSTEVLSDLVTSPEFEVSFDVTPTGKRGFMSSILLLAAATGQHYGHEGDRMPAFLLAGGSTRLTAYMGREGDHNGMCETPALPLGKTSHVTGQLRGFDFTVSINGEHGCTIGGFLKKYPRKKGVKLWVGDKFNEPARASVANVVYTPLS